MYSNEVAQARSSHILTRLQASGYAGHALIQAARAIADSMVTAALADTSYRRERVWLQLDIAGMLPDLARQTIISNDQPLTAPTKVSMIVLLDENQSIWLEPVRMHCGAFWIFPSQSQATIGLAVLNQIRHPVGSLTIESLTSQNTSEGNLQQFAVALVTPALEAAGRHSPCK